MLITAIWYIDFYTVTESETLSSKLHDTTRIRSFATAEEWHEARELWSRLLIQQSDANADAEDVGYLATHAQAQADNQCGQDDQFSPATATASVDTSLVEAGNDYTQSSHQSAQDGDGLANSTTVKRDRYALQAERILETGIDGLDNRYSELVEAKIDADRADGYSPGDADPSTSGSITYTDTGHIHPDLRIQLDGSPTQRLATVVRRDRQSRDPRDDHDRCCPRTR